MRHWGFVWGWAMISLSQFRANIFTHFKLLRDTGAIIKVYHRRKVYNIHIEPAEQSETEQLRRIKPYKIANQDIAKSDINTQACSLCGELLVNGLCTNKLCKNAMSHNIAKPVN